MRLTADHRLVCVHDRRVERTSDGRGAVSAMTYEELSALDFGGWKGAGHRGAQVLLFEDLLKEALGAGRPVGLAVETKHPTRAGGRLEAELVRVLKEHGLADGRAGLVEVMSFSRNALVRLNRLAPGLPAVYLIERRVRPPRPPFAGTPVRGSTWCARIRGWWDGCGRRGCGCGCGPWTSPRTWSCASGSEWTP